MDESDRQADIYRQTDRQMVSQATYRQRCFQQRDESCKGSVVTQQQWTAFLWSTHKYKRSKITAKIHDKKNTQTHTHPDCEIKGNHRNLRWKFLIFIYLNLSAKTKKLKRPHPASLTFLIRLITDTQTSLYLETCPHWLTDSDAF